MFSNYVGLGLDARVVYTVEKHRTSYAFLNKVVYGFIGTLNWFRPMKRLEETVRAVIEVQNAENESKELEYST
jgi:diacylglycerol kinase family enzyme